MLWRERRNLYSEQKRRSRLRLFILLGLLLASLVTGVICMTPRRQPSSPGLLTSPYAGRFAEKKTYRQSVQSIVHRIKPGDTLYQILVNHGVQPREVAALIAAYKFPAQLQKLKAGELLQLFFNGDSQRLEKIRYQYTNGLVLAMSRAGRNWVSSSYTKPETVTAALARGTIRESLYQSALDEDIDFELAMALADIFAWDIDFFVDLRPGDHYAFLYEQRFRDGTLIGNGRIIAARFYNDGTHHRAYYYRVPGKTADYYDAKGNSLRKLFLKSPLRYSRISSGFSKRRLHPVLKIYRPHPGIDYAAPAGTAVVSVGDGRVIAKGWKNGYGHVVAIRHNNRYITSYGHLSRYGSQIKKGSSVKQGQVIGYVGATGLATGPHLDYRMKKDGRFVNPLTLRLPAAQPVPPDHLSTFQQRVAFLENTFDHPLARIQSHTDGSPTTSEVPKNP